ncbi:hypothetical protein E4U57_003206 [Claviceps arundinis]|uniref:Aminoglycoside phosphotransferase domain-containing protein n=1 Tax=Claviceps arundinis TaxID=1623583 RepID=A0A9P7MNL8_9HYPO|nr:hypothetical protein E4U57_003206 [Claviceps arundinis]KAG5963231.1 hypothetical protein E4U56_002829 [Claviceps arundinis]
MSSTIRLLDHEPLTFQQALSEDFNVVQRHDQVALVEQQFSHLWSQKESIAAIVKAQLGLDEGAECSAASPEEWIRGKFNVCIPVAVESCQLSGKVMMRCPVPSALAESYYPGNIAEKLRSEIGSYAWVQQNCPDIRIPQLYGFSILDHHFTSEARLPWQSRLPNALLRWFRSIFRLAPRAPYAPISIPTQLSSSYMLLEFIGPETGCVLSESWDEYRNDPIRRERLFRGLARMVVSLARIPQPRIGSFKFDDDGSITLTNRPSFAATTTLENSGAQQSISAGETYTCTEPFVADMITLHDNYLISNESAADDKADCRGHMAIRALLRMLSHNYIKRQWRNGPFLLQLTDLDQSNIFVNHDWDITCLVDLEWLCALPPEALSAPYWLTGCAVDELVDNKECNSLTEYDAIRQAFMQALREEESRERLVWPLSAIMEDMWQSSGVWFWHCLTSVNAAYYLVAEHLCPRFSTTLTMRIEETFSHFWKEDVETHIDRKLAEFQSYEQKLGRLFQ